MTHFSSYSDDTLVELALLGEEAAYEERHGAEIDAKRAELRYIESSINAIPDPMERMVLRIRYTGSETAKPMPWRAVAMVIYKDDSDSKMLAIYRLHGRALKNLQDFIQ